MNNLGEILPNSIKLDELCLEIEDILNNLIKRGIDVKEELNTYKTLKKMLGSGNSIDELEYELKLQNLKENLDKKYNDVNIENVLSFIEYRLNANDITKEEIGTYAEDIAKILDLISEMDTEKDNLVERAYSLSYKVLKIEILLNGNSKLYELTKDNRFHIIHFSKLIQDELANADLDEESIKLIEIKKYELAKKNENSYYNIELLKMFSYLLTSNEISDVVNSNIHKIVNTCENNSELLELSNRGIKNGYSKLKHIKLWFKIKLASWILLSGVMTFIGLKGSEKTVYNNSYEVYEVSKDEPEIIVEKEYNLGSKDNVDVYFGIYNENEKKETERFVVENGASFQTNEELIEYMFQEGIEKFYSGDNKEKLNPEYYRGKQIDFEKIIRFVESNELGIEHDWVALFIAMILFTPSMFLFPILINLDPFDYRRTKNIYVERISEYFGTLLDKLRENKELFNKFYSLYLDNVNLINNPDELLNKIKELENQVENIENDKEINKARKLVK